jgi:hypothetical protein
MTWLNSIIGQGISANIGQGLGQAQASSQQSLAQQAFNNNQQYYQNQAMAAQQAFSYAQNTYRLKPYRINGQDMDFEEFIDAIYPDECAERTMLILKFQKED